MRRLLGFALTSLMLSIPANASFLGRCRVAIQKTFTSGEQKKPLVFKNILDLFFTPNEIASSRQYEFPKGHESGDSLFRGMSITREELENIRKNGLDPNLSKGEKIFFAYPNDAVFYGSVRHNDLVKDGKERISILVQLTPEWSKKLEIDEYQTAYYTYKWIPPQAIQSILAAAPDSQDRLKYTDILQREEDLKQRVSL